MTENKEDIPAKGDSEELEDTISADLRRILEDSPLSVARIASLAGMSSPSPLYHFQRSGRGLTTGTLDRLAPILGLRLVARKSRGPARDPLLMVSRGQLEKEVKIPLEEIQAKLQQHAEILKRLGEDTEDWAELRKKHEKGRKASSPTEAPPKATERSQRVRRRSSKYTQEQRDRALELLQRNYLQRTVAEELGIPIGTVGMWASKWKKSGELGELFETGEED